MRRLIGALLLSAGILFAGNTHNVGWQRTLSAQAAFTGDSVQFSLALINHEADTLHGFYFCENIPDGLNILRETVYINSSALTTMVHENSAYSALYPETITRRTILETPPSFNENNAIAPGDTFNARFWLTSQEVGSYSLQNAHWVGYFSQSGSAFGTSDEALSLTFIKKDLQINQEELVDGTVDESYQATLQVSGGTSPYTWWISSGALPPGLVLDSLSGVISGIPKEAGDFTFEVSVGDSGLIIQQDSASYDIFIENPTNISLPSELPGKFDLLGNFPNPFNPSTRIDFSLAERSHVTIQIFDLAGRRVATMVPGLLDAGLHSARFEARELNSGVYVYRLQAGPFQRTQKMLLLK